MKKEIDSSVQIMGILNVTPDSFYDGGKYLSVDKAVQKGVELVSEGAHIIDIGGESTRPGAKTVSVNEEIDRVALIVQKLVKEVDIPISVDTRKSEVALASLECGAKIINDVSGLSYDSNIAKVVAKFDASLVLMHSLGEPEIMQDNICYSNLIEDILLFLKKSISKAVSSGVNSKKIIVDPGIGFGKSVENNYTIINNIDKIKELGYQVLILKSMEMLNRVKK